MAGSRPLFVQEIRQKHPEKQVEVWFQDEARFGQQGTLTTVWADGGSRPSAVKQTEYDWIYLFAAVNPMSGDSSALLGPTVNTDYMNAHLASIGRQAGPDKHVVLVLDKAGWHVAKGLKVPENITLFHLPPYSPELNPIERIWAYLKSHFLSNRVFSDYPGLFIPPRWNVAEAERASPLMCCVRVGHEARKSPLTPIENQTVGEISLNDRCGTTKVVDAPADAAEPRQEGPMGG